VTTNGKLQIGIVLAIGLAASGCAAIPAHRGYIADPLLTQSIEAGVDNRTSIEQTLGRPTFSSQFGDPVWYYVSSNTAEKPFNTPKISAHSVLAVHFDPAGNVSTIDRTGIEQVVRLEPDDDETPTLGRDRSLFEDLFGNIGQVGGAVSTGN
jgi:outer membrane protein assembly factor BamE (lipoprotein component of BamABCDE complex)